MFGRNTHDQDEAVAWNHRVVQCSYRNRGLRSADCSGHLGRNSTRGTGALGLWPISLLVATQLLRRLRLLPTPPLALAPSPPRPLVVKSRCAGGGPISARAIAAIPLKKGGRRSRLNS
jgi:hypothetical protein